MSNVKTLSPGLKVMAKVKVCVHASHADVDSRALTLAPRTYLSQLAINCMCTSIPNHEMHYETMNSHMFPKK